MAREHLGKGPLVLISTASTDPERPPVICEAPTVNYPPEDEAGLWRVATHAEYDAYVEYWDRWYEEHGE